MRNVIISIFLVLLYLLYVPALADAPQCGPNRVGVELERADLVRLKKHVSAVVLAVGEPGGGYSRDLPAWVLPTGTCKAKDGYIAMPLDYQATFSYANTPEKVELTYRDKMMAAQARGDFSTIGKLSTEMQKAVEAAVVDSQGKSPVHLRIRTNVDASQTIDPDSVVRDGVGFIAIRASNGPDSGTESVHMHLDRVALKDADRISNFNIYGELLVPDRLDLANVRIDLDGPTALVETMVRKIAAGRILAIIAPSYQDLGR